ncbi:MAG: apolipoprotein N-acyltransferase [PVC group bacterium]|nr:apolipoprotein N-acyltransferase [PVC group bacterium]
MNQDQRQIKYIFASLFSAILLAFTFSRLNLGILAWFALIPFLLSLHKKSFKQRIFLSFIFSFFFFILTIYWIGHVTIAGLIILCIYLSLYICLFGALAKNITSILSLFTLPLLWICLEFARSYLLTGFGWALIGYSQFKNLALLQSADIFGVWGVGFLIIFVNLAILQIILLKPKHLWRSAAFCLSALLIFLTYAYGFYSLQKNFPAPDLKISVLQPNIPQEHKWDPAYKQAILDNFRQLTLAAAKDTPDLIVWPETSIPGYLLSNAKLMKYTIDLTKQSQAHILVGSPREETFGEEYYNSAFLFNSNGSLNKYHDKLHLVPFGEYVPFNKYLGFLYSFGIGDFSAGTHYTLFEMPDQQGNTARFSVLVCFEDTFPALVKQFREKGADILITITNEAWFKNSAEPVQHLAMSVFRAVENRKWFIRCANTGISCFIDPHGRIKEPVKQNNKDIFIRGHATIRLK